MHNRRDLTLWRGSQHQCRHRPFPPCPSLLPGPQLQHAGRESPPILEQGGEGEAEGEGETVIVSQWRRWRFHGFLSSLRPSSSPPVQAAEEGVAGAGAAFSLTCACHAACLHRAHHRPCRGQRQAGRRSRHPGQSQLRAALYRRAWGERVWRGRGSRAWGVSPWVHI